MSSRSAADCRGSRLPSTATVTEPCRPTAGVHAVASVASSLRTQKIRRSSAAAETSRLACGSLVAATTYQAPSRSEGRNRRSSRVSSSAIPSIAGVTSGETTVTTAPAPSSDGRRRWATCPPPTTTTLRPDRRRPTGYGGKSFTPPLSPGLRPGVFWLESEA